MHSINLNSTVQANYIILLKLIKHTQQGYKADISKDARESDK